MIVLDTHTVVWWAQSPEYLSAAALDLAVPLLTKDRLLSDLPWLDTIW
jgi:hypothetical protein